MPSRNKRNKNRSSANTISGSNTPNNGEKTVKTTNNSASNVIVSEETESSKTITEVKGNLAELQQNFDSIKATADQPSAATVTINTNENTNTEDLTNKFDEQKSEQPTVKKKRNRNRNRKKNSTNANENVVGCSSGTHESVLCAEKITEEPQSEKSVSLENANVDIIKAEEVHLTSDQNVDEQQAITNQFISNSKNAEKVKSNDEEIDIESQEVVVDEVEEKIVEHIVVEEKTNSDKKSINNEELEGTHNENETGNNVIEPDTTTDRKLEIGSQSEKIGKEVKDEIGKSEMKYDLMESDKRTPKMKNKNINQQKAIDKNNEIQQTKTAEGAEQISIEQTATIASNHTNIVDGNITVTSESISKTPTSTPNIKTPLCEDETAKIWKILEEASKSLEPVEIQMDDEPLTNTIDQSPSEINIPILSSSKNEQQLEEKEKDLVALLESVKTDTVVMTEPTNEITIQSEAKPKPKQTKPNLDSCLQKSTEPTKTASKPSTSNQQTIQKENLVEKLMEKKHEQPQEQSPPMQEVSDNILLVDDVIPLDVSILPDHIDAPEMNTDSKNVQGSGFVPSVDQSAAETKSLVLENFAKLDDTESNVLISPHKEIDVNSVDAQTKNNGTSSNTSKKSVVKNKTKLLDQSIKKRSHPIEKPNQINCSPKNSHGKLSLNNEKSSGKPLIPPKPDNLVSSQVKRSQAASTKSAKVEKILVLTGANANDEDSEDDYIEYKFMPRQVFIATICQSCKKPTKLNERIFCPLCNMVSYCNIEYMTKDEPQHKDLCAAFQEIAKKRGGHIYNNARILNDNDYRSLRVHTLNLCEIFLKRPLQTYEREILLFPRLCSKTSCREWRPNLLTDCDGCGQAFYCLAQPDHLVETHQRWCKSVELYRNLVVRQSASGRIEPSLPSRILNKPYTLPNTIGEVFKDLYKNYAVIKDECVFATLTQLATAPLTAYFATQKAELQIDEKFTIHLIGAELQFEADVLDIWETFFLHLAHNLVELTVVFCGPELNAENIPLDIISRIRMCRTCRQHCRIVKFDFQCSKLYHDYAKSTAYNKPDLICFFNPGFHHINSINGFDTWSETIKIASMSECPVVVTSYTEYESPRDLDRFQFETANHAKQMDLIHGPSLNTYASQRPERNFISDEIAPLIFKNYFCFVLK